jgi:hypothetical protein
MGLPGVPGSSGTSGITGSSGTSGNTGSSGTSGINGSSGTSGNTGSSGTSGANGAGVSGGTANKVAYFTGATSLGNSTNFHWDNTNTRLAIGNASPSYTVDVTGDLRVNAGALGVNTTPSATDGRIDATNDIVAFSSDRRLKTNIEYIVDALEKIQSLRGFTYNWNEVANRMAGFDTESRYVGVYAQDVQAMLPEAIKLAPFDNDGRNNSISGENYLTVQYEKLVPLLIEAIKELKAEVDELKRKS